jgi:hypothetical protein
MNEINTESYHKLYGDKKKRIVYQKKDFFDYLLMLLICIVVISLSYRQHEITSGIGIVLCFYMGIAFSIRHGIGYSIPIILKQPQELFYSLIYKIKNIKWPYLVAIGILLLENYLIYLTPSLPHMTELMREIGIYAFYLHFIIITSYRTVILIAHLRKKDLAHEILLQSPWKRIFKKQPSIILEIFHAYFTGVLTHLILLAPWFLIITHVNFSVLFLPLVCVVNVVISLKFIKVINAWFYRDHWLGHNSEFEFVYLHGSHHDAIPSGLIGVAGNGFLEGFYRHAIGFPNSFFNPIVACALYTFEIKNDIDTHQYIPGIYPMLPKEFQQLTQHSTHHFGKLEPYGFAMKLDQDCISDEVKHSYRKIPGEIANSAKLDEQLTGFKWDNSINRWYLDLIDKYQK